jgi:hypothetical protein
MWLVRRSALMDTTRMLRMDARLTDTTVRAGLPAESLLAPAPGTTAMDIHSIHGPMPAVMWGDSRDAVSKDVVLMDTPRSSAMALKDAARSREAAAAVAGSEADAKRIRIL